MKKSIIWRDEVNYELTTLFITTLNEMNDEGELTFYFSSRGGSITAENIILDLIENTNTEVTMVVVGEVYSAGFSLFFKANCKREILPGTIGMMHSAQVDVTLNHHGNPTYHEGVAYKKMLQTEDKLFAKELCDVLGMTPLQKKKVMRGDDVYFITEEMRKFLKNSEDIRIRKQSQKIREDLLRK